MTDFDARPVAYSYIRMSSKRQIKGDSLRRQLDLSRQYADRHNLKLDEETTFADKGVSAWAGANLTEGQFGQFLAAAKQGRIKPGSYLLVESLDRLSRQQVRTALVPFMELINGGIVIVTLNDNQVYSKATRSGSARNTANVKTGGNRREGGPIDKYSGRIRKIKTTVWLLSGGNKTFSP